MRKPRKKVLSNWRRRRVAMVAHGSDNTIKLINLFMPVRVKERTGEDTLFEGPINAVWERTLAEHRELDNGLELVGALIANDDQDLYGRIGWLQQTGPDGVLEAGANLVVNERLSSRGSVSKVETAA